MNVMNGYTISHRLFPRRLFHRFSLWAAFMALSLVLVPSDLRAEDDLEQAGAFIQDFGDRAVNALTEKDLATKELRARFRGLYDEGFDAQAISRFVVGRYWKKATTAERKEFRGLFNRFVVQTYSAKFRHYSGETFTVTGAEPEGKSVFIVSSKVLQPNGNPPITLSWRVSRSSDGFRIYDITVEGVSMAITQRSEFSSVIRNGGGKISALIDALRDKTTKLASKNGEEAENAN